MPESLFNPLRQDVKMSLDAGTIVTIVCVLLFYLRLTVIQRQRIKRAQHQYAAVQKKNTKKNGMQPEVRYNRLGVHIRSWWLVAGAIVLITFGAVVAATHFLGMPLSSYWWIPLNLGIGFFALGIN
jgi:ABC-type Fe3+ transport system permease subunit